MSELSQVLVDTVSYEGVLKTVAVFAGRFQPFHKGHYSIYQLLIKKFGVDSVFIGTSNKVDSQKSPFNFKEKQQIINTIFKIPKSKIVQVKNPFSPIEILNKFDEKTTAFVTAFSEKDIGRLGGKYYKPYKTGSLVKGYKENGYYIVAPELKINVGGKNISGTVIRKMLGSNIEVDEKKKLFKSLYGKFDNAVYDLIIGKLTEAYVTITNYDIDNFIVTGGLIKLLKEITGTSNFAGEVDDGPGAWMPSSGVFKRVSHDRAEQIGYVVMDYLMNLDGSMDEDEYPLYPNGPVPAVTYFPAGDYGVLTAINQIDMYGAEAYNEWLKHITRTASMVGYELVKTREELEDMAADKKQAGKAAKDSKKLINRNKLTETSVKDILGNVIKDLISDRKASLLEKPLSTKILLQCGGTYGHMSHPFENMKLTFSDLKQMIELGLTGNLDIEKQVTEKLDGQAISVSWKNGKLIAARNKGQLKNYGMNAPDVEGIKQMFAGRGDITDAFVLAVKDLDAAISKLSDKQRDKMFGEGKRFMNIEIIFPATQNVVPYGLNLLTFHGILEYDESGSVIGTGPKDSAKMLAGMIKQVNADVQKTYKIQGPQVLTLPKVRDFAKKKEIFNNKIDLLRKKFKLNNSDFVMMYHQAWWESFITKNAEKIKYTLPNNVLVGLVKRWAFFDKAYSVKNMKEDIDNVKFLTWVRKFDKEDHADRFKENVRPFEEIFLKLGAEVLKNAKGFISVNPKKAVRDMKKELETAILELEKTTDIKKIKILKKQLKRLAAIGGTSKIVPSEGLVFVYKGNVYKLSGAFAIQNQLLGVFKFG